MKNLFLIAIMAMALPAMAEAKWSFCAVETPHEGVHCSNAKFTYSSYIAHQKCQLWANGQNLPLLSTFTVNTKKAAIDKQEEVCDSLPGKGKWQCFKIEDCGMSSSISPIDKRVFAPTGATEQARDECVRRGWKIFSQSLIDLPHGCKLAPDAVQMMY
jgi:hypothetical protein